MAGLATALNVVGAVGAVVDNLLFGATGTVTLGPVTFFGQEVPVRISIGGAQSLKVYKYTGGQRTLDAKCRTRDLGHLRIRIISLEAVIFRVCFNGIQKYKFQVWA